MTHCLLFSGLKDLPGPPEGKRQIIHYDAELPGFGVRITAGGSRSLILNYRADGVERRITLATLPARLSAEDGRRIFEGARKEAARLKAAVKYEGADPMGKRHQYREAPTVADLCERFMTDHLPKKRPSTQRDYGAIIDRIILPAIGRQRVADLSHADIDDMHRGASKTAPFRANRAVAITSRMLNLAIKWGWRTDNPAKGIERNPEPPRERYLTPAELTALAKALDAHEDQMIADLIRLLLITGARSGEVKAAEWSQFDLEHGIWTKPSSHTKQKRSHRFPLSHIAIQLLTDLKQRAEIDIAELERATRRAGPIEADRLRQRIEWTRRYVFPAARGETGHITEIKKAWAQICRAAGLVETRIVNGKKKIVHTVRPHDLRHTNASLLASAGMSLPIIGRMLGHTQAQTTMRYAHLLDDPLRKAAEAVGTVIGAAQIERTKDEGQ